MKKSKEWPRWRSIGGFVGQCTIDFVGADAHIGPQNRLLDQWVDVGIDPYKHNR